MTPLHGRERALRATVLALATGLVAILPASGQQDYSAVQIQATHVAGPVHMLVGAGGNIAVSSGADGTLMVDDQFAPLADKIRAALAEIGQSPEAAQPRFVLNTHWHGDHTGGNAEFGPEATIIAHTNVRGRMSTPQSRGGNVTPAAPAEALPVITFDRSVDVHFNGERISVIHIPHGHTDGDAVIYFTDSNVVHMGDDFFAGRFPFVDIASGGSVEGLQAGIGSVLDDLPADASVIPGHGPLSSVEDLSLYKRMLDETIGSVREQMDAGASVEDIVARGPGEEWADWGAGFISAERWLQTIHQSLSGANDADYTAHGHTHEKGGDRHR